MASRLLRRWQERQKAREEQAAAAQAEAEASGGAGAGGEAGKGGAGGGAGPVVQPYAAEQLTLDQLLAWLRKLLPADEPAKASEAGGPAQGKGQVEVPQGARARGLCPPSVWRGGALAPVCARAPLLAAVPPPVPPPCAPRARGPAWSASPSVPHARTLSRARARTRPLPPGMKPMRRKDDDDGGGLSVAKKKPAQGKV